MIAPIADEPIKRRQLYAMALDQVHGIERHERAITLAGTYQAETGTLVGAVDVALIAFFPKSTDPGAIKRPSVLAPAKIDLTAAWKTYWDSRS